MSPSHPVGHTVTITLTCPDPSAVRDLGDVDALIGAGADELYLPPALTIAEVTFDAADGGHRGTSCVPQSLFDELVKWMGTRAGALRKTDEIIIGLQRENLLLRTVTVDLSRLKVRWSAEDEAFVATTDTYPSLSSVDADAAAAVHGLHHLITEIEAERGGRLDLSEYFIAVNADGEPELRHRPGKPGPDESFDGHPVEADIPGTATDLTRIVDAVYTHHRDHHPLSTHEEKQ